MALVSVPCLLLPKPLLLKKQHESNARFQARFPPDSIPRESRESIATRTAPGPTLPICTKSIPTNAAPFVGSLSVLKLGEGFALSRLSCSLALSFARPLSASRRVFFV